MHKGQVLSIRHYVQPTECSKHQGDDGTTVESTPQTANTFSAKIVPIVSVRPDGHLHMICAYHPPEIVCTWTLGNTATKPMNSLHLCARVQGCATPASLKLSIWGRPCIACIARMRQGETGGGGLLHLATFLPIRTILHLQPLHVLLVITLRCRGVGAYVMLVVVSMECYIAM